MKMDELPRLLANLKLAPGVIKMDYEDFVVEEIPLYEACGTGTHTYFLVQKHGLGTMPAVHDLARALDVPRREIGYAGLKDARAVTRQWMSVEHVDPERVKELSIPRIEILETTRHTNKLKLGHLRANHFVIRVRHTQPQRQKELAAGLEQLVTRGVPNYFGPQRFGGRGDAWKIGRAIVRSDLEGALDLVLGNPCERDSGDILRARELYELGNYPHALRAWPGMFRDERRALKTLHRTKGNKRIAFSAIDHSLRRFYVSAYQSHLFNSVLAERLASGPDRIECGDLAWIHEKGAVFEVLDPLVEQPRADAFEISPTGPLYGYRMTQPKHRPGQTEARILAAEDLTSDSFRSKPLRLKGARRALRFQPTNAQISLGADQRGAYLELRFTLPRGCYATSLLRELFQEQRPVWDAAPVGISGAEDI